MANKRSDIVAITCSSCGGAVALEAGKTLPRCLYCGSEALDEGMLDERIEQPETFLPFGISDEEADAAFRKFTRSSIWYPNEIRQARLELEPLLLAAWTWAGLVETHYAGLVSASTASGKAPVTGSDITRLEGVVVPSSSALTRAELAAIAPFAYAEEQPYDVHTAGLMFEPGRLSRSMARSQALDQMARTHAAQLKAREGASSLNPATVLSDVDGRPVLLPVYIGVWRYGDQPYRVVINGQTGRLTGKAPISWLKIVAAVAGVLLLVALMALCMGLFAAVQGG